MLMDRRNLFIITNLHALCAMNGNISSSLRVIVDGILIGNRIYWTITANNYN
jgi:hypothetical protein